MNAKTIIGVIVLLIVIAGGWYLVSKTPASTDTGTGPIKIGVIVPLTGEAASYGEAAKNGLNVALKELNDAGGIKGRQVQLVYEDDKCDSSSVSAMQKLVSVDGVVAIIGPVCSAAAGPAIPIARDAGTPEILIGASAPGLAGGDDSIFSDYASDNFQGKYVANYIYKTLGKKSAAILYVKNDWGQGLQKVFSDEFQKLGGTIVFNDGAAQDATDVKSIVTKMKAANPDVIYMPVYPALAVIAMKQMKQIGITQPVVGGDALEASEFLSSGAADGVTYVTAAVGNSDAFQAKVKAVNGQDAVINIITPLGYDALNVYAQVIGEKGTNAKDIIAGLKALDYKTGVSFPEISYDQNGDLKQASYDVKIVKGTTPQIITPAQ